MAYLALDVNYAEDARVIELSPLAQYLNVRAALISKRLESDGLVTLPQLERDCYNFLDLPKLIEEQLTIGTWERVDDRTFRIADFLRSNKSHEELEALREDRRERSRVGGQKSGETRRAKQPASTTSKQAASPDDKKLLRHVEPISSHSNASDLNSPELSTRSRAHALTELAFSQLPKPTKRRATIENLIERFLEAGHVDEDIRNAIVAGDVTWTDGALTYAISQSRRKTEPSPEEVDQLVEEAFRFLDQSVFRKDPARPVSNAIVEEALKRKTPQQLGESESVTRSLLRSIAAKVAVSK
jgi:hypothetical protein